MIRAVAISLLNMIFIACAAGATADLDGVEVRWVAEGDGKTIVFVHGWTCEMSVWSEQMAAFNQNYRVIRLDLPGHGESGSPEGEEFTMALYADAVEAVRKDAGAGEIVLVGHSMGALVVGQYALRYPEHVAGVVAVDGFLQPPPSRPAPTPEPGPEPDALTMDMREQIISDMFVPETAAGLRAQILAMMLSPSNDRAMAVGAAMRTFQSSPDDTIAAPTLTFAAATNVMLEQTVTRSRGNRTEIIPGTGHFLMMEKPAEFNQRLRDFLQEISF